MTNPAYEATNSNVEKLINCEIADFFAGIGQPGEPETPQEMQQQLQSRISAIFNAAPNGMMQLSNELAEMKLPEDFPDDAELLIEIEFLDDVSVDIKTAQWLKELRRRRAAGGTVEGSE
ncbi:hypothetical protein [Buttiauxella gaviniae]|uniref:hypothetical protein n=1 Tax=Buttiauxella gaviniae TaxID=82990 RepID=UPI0039AF3B57